MRREGGAQEKDDDSGGVGSRGPRLALSSSSRSVCINQSADPTSSPEPSTDPQERLDVYFTLIPLLDVYSRLLVARSGSGLVFKSM